MVSYPNQNTLGHATYLVNRASIVGATTMSINVVNLAPTQTSSYKIELRGMQDESSGHWWKSQGGVTLKITRIGV